jgi:FkbM family methyltransferase
LYAPKKFKGAKVLPVFEQYFGNDRTNVCSIGFEPNVAHTEYLNKLNEHFANQKYQGFIFTEHAVSSHRGNMTFFRDPRAPKRAHEWGASLAAWKSGNIPTTNVQLVSLPELMEQIVMPIVSEEKKRTGLSPPIVMKMDIEGAEYTVFPAIAISGALCHVNLIFLEWHPESFRVKMPEHVEMDKNQLLNTFSKLRATYPSCQVNISTLDDETYLDGKRIPF